MIGHEWSKCSGMSNGRIYASQQLGAVHALGWADVRRHRRVLYRGAADTHRQGHRGITRTPGTSGYTSLRRGVCYLSCHTGHEGWTMLLHADVDMHE